MGWDASNSNVISFDDAAGIVHNVISEYGQLTKEEITDICAYISDNNHRAQHIMQLYHCLQYSLSKEGQLKIISERNEYNIGGVPCASLLWKLLIQKVVIDTRATVTQYRTKLSSIDVYMDTVNSDIDKFNAYVELNYKGINARGERCDDLMTKLFKGYLDAADRKFVCYVNTKQEAYNNGKYITSDKLMTVALNKFEILSINSQWKSKSPEEEQTVAMSSKIRKIKDDNLSI